MRHRHIPFLSKCSGHGRRACWFCLANTMGFPIEHLIWQKAPVFSSVSKLLGL